jgi:hypothetical protein
VMLAMSAHSLGVGNAWSFMVVHGSVSALFATNEKTGSPYAFLHQ